MSLDRRTYFSLVCDAGCGSRLDTEAANPVSARIDGATKGWRFIEGVWLVEREQRSAYHQRNDKEQTVRALDICPDCEVPPNGTRIDRPAS